MPGTVEMLADRCGRALLPRDEHAPPGRAPGNRGGHRSRPRRRPAAHRRRARPSPSSGCARRRRSNGHAIEARLYAEDPEAGFLPATGTAGAAPLAGRRPHRHRRRGGGRRVGPLRPDAGQAHRPRPEPRGCARPVCEEALDATTILGVRTNLRFLRWLARPAGRCATARCAPTRSRGSSCPRRRSRTTAHWQAAAHALEPPDSRRRGAADGG